MKPIKEEEDFTQSIAGIEQSNRSSKTVYSNGLSEVFFTLCLIMLLIPIGAFVIGGAVVILRQIQAPPKCSVSLTTRYAIELGRFENG